MADPTAAEVAAAIATLEAFEHAQHPVAAPVEPVKHLEPAQAEPHAAASVAEAASAQVHSAAVESPTTSSAPSEPAPAAKPVPSLVEAVDPYLARSVKSSPNGF